MAEPRVTLITGARQGIGRLAIKRLGRFEDVANVIDFFVRPESEYVTGQVIYLGGP